MAFYIVLSIVSSCINWAALIIDHVCPILDIITKSFRIYQICETFLPPANEVWGKVIFLHLFVILFTRGYLTPPWEQTPPGTRYTPQDQVHPPDQVHPRGPGTPPRADTPRDQVHPPRSRHPPGAEHAGRYGQYVGGTHPTGMQSYIITSRNEVVVKVMFLLEFVILFTGGWGVCLSACWDTTPQSRHPLGPGTPPEADTPLVQSMLGDTVNMWVVRILLECNLVLLPATMKLWPR